MKNIIYSNKFKKDLRSVIGNKNYNEEELKEVLNKLANGQILDIKYRNHKMLNTHLYGEGSKNFHLKADILVFYKIDDDSVNVLRIGNHSQLLGNEKRNKKGKARR